MSIFKAVLAVIAHRGRGVLKECTCSCFLLIYVFVMYERVYCSVGLGFKEYATLYQK